jgi:hypothetical protein
MAAGFLVGTTGSAAAVRATVTVGVTGKGVVRSVPAGLINCGVSCAATVDVGTTVVLEATPAELTQFSGWSGGCTGRARVCEVAVEDTTVVQARFDPGLLPAFPPARRLGVTRAGPGSVASSPSGVIACGTACSTGFSGGGRVRLVASPSSGAVFVGWGGACRGTATCTAVLNVNRDVTATFRPRRVRPGAATLTVNNTGLSSANNPIRVSTATGVTECKSTCSVLVANGSSVQLDGEVLRSWTGACVGQGPRCVLVATGPATTTGKIIVLEQANTFYGLNISKSGAGRVASKPSGIDCGPPTGCAASFKRDITVVITATPAQGSRFVRWRGDCGSVATPKCSLKADAIKSAAAVFQLLRDELRLEKAGDGSGVVTSTPEGIDCGDTCRYAFVRGSELDVRAAAAPGSRFAGWQGPCTGTGVCAFTIRQATTLSARFMRKCAARTFRDFGVEAKRKPRRFVVRVELDSRAAVRLLLLRRGRTLAQKAFPNAAEGKQVLALKVPRGVRAGRARVQVRVRDICGEAKALSRPVRVR